MPEPVDPIRAAAREAMERQNLSARKLAARVGVNKETVLDFVHGRRKTHNAVQLLICTELGLDPTKTQKATA